jgi:hypothetical protein
MTRFNIIPVLVSSATILAAIGCGDAGSLDAADGHDGERFASPLCDEACESARIEEELELACESFCDAVSACPGRFVTIDCVDRCLVLYSAEAETGAECAASRIDFLNCYSAQSCSASPLDIGRECGDAVSDMDAACGATVFRAAEETESGRELTEIGEVGEHVWTDTDGGVEETSPTDGFEDEESEVTDVTDPVVIADIPEADPVIEFPWIGASDDD